LHRIIRACGSCCKRDWIDEDHLAGF
jgi:hypothetical protein